MTADQLNSIAENALEEKYTLIITKLQESAAQGKNSYITDDLPEPLYRKLTNKGYVIIPIFKYKYDYLLRKKKKKYFMVQF
ncbi:hypothetical protein LNQ81_13870 [Myroides sp. M-43]|uniref:hypothetical protein n=1 Tax=Myroides oncorhynchi TaxID=2893756 RepID=UPI001E28B168|nr:hypothetical protein [Myroides oncorhynchi]MCC9043762.1 hypothetical protein [Myroides oncorhynchi]